MLHEVVILLAIFVLRFPGVAITVADKGFLRKHVRSEPVELALALPILLVSMRRIESADRAGERERAVFIDESEDRQCARTDGKISPLVFGLLPPIRLRFLRISVRGYCQ